MQRLQSRVNQEPRIKTSYRVERPGAVRKSLGLHPQPLQHGNKEIRQGEVVATRFFLPGFTTAVPRAAGIIEVQAVLEAYALSAS